MTIYSSLAAALLIASPLLTAAQVDYPACRTSWSWSFNSLGQSPCGVAAQLQAVCNHGEFSIPSLIPGDAYVGPTRLYDSSDLCKCNTVVYSLMSACGACQLEDALWFTWTTWSVNCSALDPISTFSNTIPNGTRVPAWAFLDVTNRGTWNPVLSYQVGDNPEVGAGQLGTLSPLPTPTTTQTSVPGLSPSQAQFKGNVHHGNKATAIAGGVLGITIFIVVVAIIYLRRSVSQVASSGVGVSQPMQNDEAVEQTPSGTPLTMNFYDPNDPTTFPGYQGSPLSQDIFSVSQVPLSSHVRSGVTRPDMRTSQTYVRGYHGLPQPS